MKDNYQIQVIDLKKDYKLYEQKNDRLKEAFSLIRKCYHKTHHALNGISFDVKKGETVGIIGTNGSGKSTLLKILTGVVDKSSGEVSVNGKISALLELGAGFNKNYTGRQNIYLYGTMSGFTKSEMEKKVDSIISFADIGDFIDQPAKTYSSGMFARLAFATAINVEPDILIVDEALSVGDVFFQNKCFRKFDELREKGVTILFVSHDIESVKHMCNRVLWIEHGNQMMFGKAKEVCNAYATSIQGKNNRESTVGEIAENQYSKYELNLSDFPGITEYGKDSILNENVRIKGFFFEDNNGVTYDITCGEEYKLSILFESDIDIENAIAGFVLQTKKGVSILNENSLISGDKTTFTVKGNTLNRVDFSFKMPFLTSDEYILDCAIAQGRTVNNSIMITWLYGALRVFVDNPLGNLALLDVETEVKLCERSK